MNGRVSDPVLDRFVRWLAEDVLDDVLSCSYEATHRVDAGRGTDTVHLNVIAVTGSGRYRFSIDAVFAQDYAPDNWGFREYTCTTPQRTN